MLESAIWVLLVGVPAYVAWRLYRTGPAGLFNVLLYPLVLSYAYLLLPSLIVADTPLSTVLGLSDESRIATNAFSAWYVFVFLAAYWLTRDQDIAFNEDLRIDGTLRLAAQVAQGLTTALLLFVLFRHGPELLARSHDRFAAYEYYAAEILNTYRIPVVFAFALAGATVRFLGTGHKRHLVPLLLFAVLDLLHGGRGYTMSVLVAGYLNIVARSRSAYKTATMLAATGGLAVFCSAFYRRHVLASASSDALVDFAGEFYYTRLTARYVYDHLRGAEGLLGYIGEAVGRLIPQFIVGPLLDGGESFASIVNRDINAGFGVAGSVLSEALYYGDTEFTLVSPVLIAGMYWVCCRRAFVSRLPGYLLFVLMTSTAHVCFRSGFYVQFFSTLYTVFVYLGVFAVLGSKKKVLLSQPDSTRTARESAVNAASRSTGTPLSRR